jgi:hypothetical protein
LIELIPTPDEVAVRPNQPLLDQEVIDQIEEVANGDLATVKLLTGFITKTVKAVNPSAIEGKTSCKVKISKKELKRNFAIPMPTRFRCRFISSLSV